MSPWACILMWIAVLIMFFIQVLYLCPLSETISMDEELQDSGNSAPTRRQDQVI